MKVSSTPIPDVLLIEPRIWSDERGYFFEAFNARAMREAGIEAEFVQDNHSRSKKGVLRGLHYQIPRAQGKLVRVCEGRVYDVVVDLRRKSPTFAKWYGVELTEDNYRMLWMPPGIAHGFLVLSETADFLYKTTEYYFPEDERTLQWNDPALGIPWPKMSADPTLSNKDANAVLLRDAEVYE